jgi:hypothetical protein
MTTTNRERADTAGAAAGASSRAGRVSSGEQLGIYESEDGGSYKRCQKQQLVEQGAIPEGEALYPKRQRTFNNITLVNATNVSRS